jgi:hypothetical protein
VSPRDWATLEEAHLRLTLAREEASNRDYSRRCPGVRETPCYQRGLPPKSNYYTEAEYLRAQIDLESGPLQPGGALLHVVWRAPSKEVATWAI